MVQWLIVWLVHWLSGWLIYPPQTNATGEEGQAGDESSRAVPEREGPEGGPRENALVRRVRPAVSGVVVTNHHYRIIITIAMAIAVAIKIGDRIPSGIDERQC